MADWACYPTDTYRYSYAWGPETHVAPAGQHRELSNQTCRPGDELTGWKIIRFYSTPRIGLHLT